MPQSTLTGYMIPPPLGRYIRYWYTYRTAVAVLIALVVTVLMFGLYVEQIACDANPHSCAISLSVHPEDRLFSESPPQPQIVVVGIDDASVKNIGEYPVPRDKYAVVLRNLEASGASVVVFDVNFADKRELVPDDDFARALRESTVPVIPAYGGENTIAREGRLEQTSAKTDPAGVDQLPLKKFWCADANSSPSVPCQKPIKNVILASTDVVLDSDGVLRRMPMFVQPACSSTGACALSTINPLGFAAYRAFSLLPDPSTGPSLEESGGHATFGTAWQHPLEVDRTGSAFINYSTGPGQFKNKYHQYLSFSDAYQASFPSDKVKGNIVLVGGYYLTGVPDEFLTPAGNGTKMPGVEVHANLLNMLLPLQPKFLMSEPAALLVLIILLLALATAVGVARVTVLWGWDGTVDKYVGDEIMAFWNAPRLQDNHALLAIRCAYDCINRAAELQQKLLAKGLPPIRWGIGINTGPAVVGNMGSRSRLQYTALGDTVNTAARFCSHAPAFEVLIGQQTYEMCRDYIAVDLVPGVQLKGKSAETFRIYEVTAVRETPTDPWVQFPTQMATQAHHTFTTQYTQQTVIAAGESGSSEILVGEAAQEALARQAQSPN